MSSSSTNPLGHCVLQRTAVYLSVLEGVLPGNRCVNQPLLRLSLPVHRQTKWANQDLESALCCVSARHPVYSFSLGWLCTQLHGQFRHRYITTHGSLWLPASLVSRAGSWCGVSVQSSTTCRCITRFGRLPALPSSALLLGTNAWRTDTAHQPLPMSWVKRFGSLQRIFSSKQTFIS